MRDDGVRLPSPAEIDFLERQAAQNWVPPQPFVYEIEVPVEPSARRLAAANLAAEAARTDDLDERIDLFSRACDFSSEFEGDLRRAIEVKAEREAEVVRQERKRRALEAAQRRSEALELFQATNWREEHPTDAAKALERLWFELLGERPRSQEALVNQFAEYVDLLPRGPRRELDELLQFFERERVHHAAMQRTRKARRAARAEQERAAAEAAEVVRRQVENFERVFIPLLELAARVVDMRHDLRDEYAKLESCRGEIALLPQGIRDLYLLIVTAHPEIVLLAEKERSDRSQPDDRPMQQAEISDEIGAEATTLSAEARRTSRGGWLRRLRGTSGREPQALDSARFSPGDVQPVPVASIVHQSRPPTPYADLAVDIQDCLDTLPAWITQPVGDGST